MRILLLSDIHANLVALETVLRVAPAHDAIWCLGDVVGYGPHPNECVARLRSLDALTLTGNHDQAAIGSVSLSHFRENARLALEWTQQVLTPASCAWLAERTPQQTLAAFDLTLVHGSPRDPIWEYIENAPRALENFAFFDTAFCFFGHTHHPIAYQLRVQDRVLAPRLLADRKPYALAPKLLLNPGSVGQPRDGDSRAAFGIYDTDTRVFEPRRVEYDISATQRAMTNLNLPAALIARLAQGA
ncbi:MAG: metallophosphoesterase family protein [Chloroflexi bacterium]|nr:metallophosphoesterase family protein [Chloroflexota bacterium]